MVRRSCFYTSAPGGPAKAEYVFITLDVPGAVRTFAEGINSAGQIVGFYEDGFTTRAFLYSGGSYTTFAVPGAFETRALGINASGQISGQYDAGGRAFGFRLSGGTYTKRKRGRSSIPIPDELRPRSRPFKA